MRPLHYVRMINAPSGNRTRLGGKKVLKERGFSTSSMICSQICSQNSFVNFGKFVVISNKKRYNNHRNQGG